MSRATRSAATAAIVSSTANVALHSQTPDTLRGRLVVNGPLPMGFGDFFSEVVAKATACQPSEVAVLGTFCEDSSCTKVVLDFQAPPSVVQAVESQAVDPHSRLSNGGLRSFLVAGMKPPRLLGNFGLNQITVLVDPTAPAGLLPSTTSTTHAAVGVPAPAPLESPVTNGGQMDVDTEMPYGEIEPFGREDTAQELTEASIRESDAMVDQLERAEVAEEKRAVFRALTRLRGAAIASFDGIARSQSGNVDEYSKVHQWRQTHPLDHLADSESDIAKWAFPVNADF